MMAASMVQGYPERERRLPLDFAQVTPGWLTEVFQPRYPGVKIAAMTLLQTIPGHTTKARYALERNPAAIDAGIPAQVCLKANWTGDPLSSEVCVNEARFFQLLRSSFDLPAPQCHFADWDDDDQGRQGLIMLEDLVPQGGQFGASGQSLSIDEVAASLEQLALLHGRTWNAQELRDHAWLQTAVAADTPTDDYWTLMKDYVGAHNAKPDHLAVLPGWAAQQPARLHEAFLQLRAQETADPRPLCLVHGDAHAGNSYRRTDGRRLWFDWQIVRKGRPFRDVTYFLVGSLSIEDRRTAERQLIDHYCGAMAALGAAIDRETAWRDHRRWLLWGVIAWHLNINPNEPTIPTLEKFCRAADDLDTLSFYSA